MFVNKQECSDFDITNYNMHSMAVLKRCKVNFAVLIIIIIMCVWQA